MTTVEQIANLIAGVFVKTPVMNDDEENSDEDDDDDIQFLGYAELEDVRQGKIRVNSVKPKQLIGVIHSIETKEKWNFRGNVHLLGSWWRVIALRTKKAKDKRHYPSDMHALTYRLRDDEECMKEKHNVAHMLLWQIGEDLNIKKKEEQDGEADNDQSGSQAKEEKEPKMDKRPVYFRGRALFDKYLRERDQYNDLQISNLEERVTEFYESFIEMPEDDSSVKEEDEEDPLGFHTQGFHKTCVAKKKEGYEPARDFKDMVLNSLDWRCIKLAQNYPVLVRYLPQLFPYQFLGLANLKDDDKHQSLLSAIEENPGCLAFKQIASKEYGLVGMETSHQALERCGLLAKVPQVERDAILIYEYLKLKTKQDGHTGVQFDAIMNKFGSELGLIEEAHQFLEKHKITKTRMEGGYRMVYLMWLWNCEKSIAKGISSLYSLQEAQPWKLDVDWDSEQFTSIKKDNDQWRAAQLIASQPVVAISGKGGCGKTYVVTQVITAAKAASPTSTEPENDKLSNKDADDSDMLDDSDLMEYREPEQLKQPHSVKLLLTAPTGKAANLLGKRANQPSFTLHQVIYSHGRDIEWKHKDVNTLVVDECSLVAVSTFSHLIQLLIKHAQLRRIVLLGDVRQLPSIEPGNFLDDTFRSLERLGCGLELRNNHRAESQIIVDNATKISKKIYPEFVVDKFTLLRVPEGNPFETGDDTVSDDTEIEVRKVLNLPELQDDTNSQFISFTRKICDRINEACCRKYAEHTTRNSRNRLDFRVKDKICCTKNGYVTLYNYEHGDMAKMANTDPGKHKSNKTADATLNNSSAGLQHDEDDLAAEEDKGSNSGKKKPKEMKRRLCNGEIFFIEDVKIIHESRYKQVEYFYLTERDPDEPDAGFWVERRELKRQCKIRHAWARTIHTFQGSETDHIVYIVGKRNRHQNWQHVYTAITRGRKSVFIIGQESVLRQVIKTKETKRNTSLRKQLTELLQKNPDFLSSQSVLKQSMLCMSPVPPASKARNPHLDMTEGVTGLLAELAQEHDGIDADESHVIDYVTETKMATSENVNSANDRIGNTVICQLTGEFPDNSKTANNNQALNVIYAGNEEQGRLRKTRLKKKTEYQYKEVDSPNRSPLHINLMKKNSRRLSSPFNTGNNADIDNNESFEISDCDSPASQTGPRSNESVWSEADESQYASFLDATMNALNSGALKVDKDNGSAVNLCVNKPDMQNQGTFVPNTSKSGLVSPRFTRLKPLYKASVSGFELKNLGQKPFDGTKDQKPVNDASLNNENSQWSDLLDEQCMTLNLEDIENMERDFDARNNRKKSLTESKAVNLDDSDDDFEDIKPYRRSKTSVSNMQIKNGILNLNDFKKDLDESVTESKGDKGKYRDQNPLLKTPEKQVKVKDTPPLPSVPDTPPDQYSRKRRSVESHEDMITSPSKQRKDLNAVTGFSKQRKDQKDLSLTPLKRSLADLHFK